MEYYDLVSMLTNNPARDVLKQNKGFFKFCCLAKMHLFLLMIFYLS